MNMTTNSHRRPDRSGFTLVEILTVIVIIGILAGIAIPAINGALRTSKEAAVRLEIDVVGQALESYRLQYGSYPPDFSDWDQVEKHYRKAFPNIADSELKLLAQYTWLNNNFSRVPTTGDLDPRTAGNAYAYYRACMDPAEALVFCLGGYSSDKKHPFTGAGGPLSPVVGGGGANASAYTLYQYNVERDNQFMDFAGGLSLVVCNDPTAGNATPNPLGAASAYTYSSEEYATNVNGTSVVEAFSTRGVGSPFAAIRFLVDPFPTYSSNDRTGALVYFNSNNYTDTFSPNVPGGGWATNGNAFHALNVFFPPQGDNELGVARPYLTDQLNTNAGGFLWAEEDRFQIVSAGMDGSFGGVIAPGVVIPGDTTTVLAAGLVTRFPSGTASDAGGNAPAGSDKYEDSEAVYGAEKPQLDNITNFSTRTLESDLR